MRMQNFGGSVYERLAIRRGLVAAGTGAVAIGGATWAGKEVSARMPAATGSTWRNVTLGVAKGAALGAATGCVAGAAAGLVTAGALSLPGCFAGALGNALVAGFIGGYGSYVDLDEGGTVRVPVGDLNQLIKLAGSNAAQATTKPVAQATLDLCPSGYADSERIDAVYVKYGANRRYACDAGNGQFAVAINVTMPYKHNPSTNTEGVFSADDMFVQSISCGIGVPSLTGYCGSGKSPLGFATWIGTRGANSTTKTAVGIFLSPDKHNKATEQYQDYSGELSPVEGAPAWAAVLGDQINASANQLKLSNQVLAGMLNALHKQMTNDGSLPQGVPAYDPNDPITSDDVQAVKNAHPELSPTIGDLSKPFTTPGREPTGGTASSPVAPPQDVNVVNGSTNGQGQTTVNVDAKVDLGPSGDTSMPTADTSKPFAALDTLTTALDPWRKLSMSWPTAQCPVLSVDFRPMFGRYAGDRAYISESSWCTWLGEGTDARAILQLAMILATTIGMIYKFMEA